MFLNNLNNQSHNFILYVRVIIVWARMVESGHLFSRTQSSRILAEKLSKNGGLQGRERYFPSYLVEQNKTKQNILVRGTVRLPFYLNIEDLS